MCSKNLRIRGLKFAREATTERLYSTFFRTHWSNGSSLVATYPGALEGLSCFSFVVSSLHVSSALLQPGQPSPPPCSKAWRFLSFLCRIRPGGGGQVGNLIDFEVLALDEFNGVGTSNSFLIQVSQWFKHSHRLSPVVWPQRLPPHPLGCAQCHWAQLCFDLFCPS